MNLELQQRRNSKETFRRIYRWDKFDVCRFTNDIDTLTSSIFKHYLLWANETFQGLLHKCPYKDLILKSLTVSISSYEVDTFVPNGELRLIVNIFNNRDRNIVSFKLSWEQNYIDV